MSASAAPPPSSLSPPPPPVLSGVSSQHSSLSITSFMSNMQNRRTSPRRRTAPCSSPAAQISSLSSPSSPSLSSSSSLSFKLSSSKTKKNGTPSIWLSKLFKLGKLSMDAEEGLLLHQTGAASQGCHDDRKLAEKLPTKELRFVTKIAVAMDADGFIGVKNSVCAPDDEFIEVEHTIGTAHYCVPNPNHSTLQRMEAPASKQARRPRRRRRRPWKLLRRICRTRVLFVCLFHKMRKAFTSSSNLTSLGHDN